MRRTITWLSAVVTVAAVVSVVGAADQPSVGAASTEATAKGIRIMGAHQ